MKKLVSLILSFSIFHFQFSIAQNVGIGTTTPASPLEIAKSSASMSGAITSPSPTQEPTRGRAIFTSNSGQTILPNEV